MTDRTLKKSILLKATPQSVWAWLTEPEKLAVWFNRPDVALLDGPYEMSKADTGEKLIWGEVLRAEPFLQLHYTFNIAPFGGTETLVEWTLEEVEGGTMLSMVHRGLPEGAETLDLVLALDKGWEVHMDTLRSAVTVG